MMKDILVVDNAMVSVRIYPERKMVHHVMKTYCYGREFREGLTRGTEALKRYRATKWLSDDRATGPVPKDDEEWAYKTWLPQTVAAGWKHWAILAPEKVIAQIKYDRAAKSFGDLGINAHFFSDADAAMQWLEAQ